MDEPTKLSESLILMFDLETTGFGAKNRICEIGFAYFKGGRLLCEAESFLINPQIPIPSYATDIHGISDHDVRDAKTFKEFMPTIIAHLNGSWAEDNLGEEGPILLGGYNAPRFDVPFLNRAYERVGSDERIDPDDVFDVLPFVKKRIQGSAKLGAACKELAVDIDDAHEAWADAKATGSLLYMCISIGWIPDSLDEAFFNA